MPPLLCDTQNNFGDLPDVLRDPATIDLDHVGVIFPGYTVKLSRNVERTDREATDTSATCSFGDFDTSRQGLK